MKKLFLSTAMMVCMVSVNAQQDVHYSQFYSMPLAINPATAGIFEGGFRLNMDYRSQWKSVTTPWNTIAASADMKFLEDDISGNFFTGGAMFYTDKAGDSNFKTGLYNLAFGYTVHISKGAYFSTAIQGGIIQNSMDYNSLYFESQYNGYEFDKSWPTNEIQSGAVSFTKGDLSLGVNYFNEIDDDKTIFIGAAGNHLLAHKVNFLTTSDRIFRKVTIHGGAQFKIERMAFVPNFLVALQGPNQVINIGNELRIWLREQSHFTGFNDEMSFGIGTYYRLGDALLLGGKFNYAGFTLTGSFDFNTSQFNVATGGNGGFEIMVGYRANFGTGKGKQTRFL
jgi:type IX secretion system PorP/SprF family membrane protein